MSGGTSIERCIIESRFSAHCHDLLAELARLRRMADLACKIAAHTRGARGVVFCHACKGSGLGIGIECVRHTATCDVAIHLGLAREKGDGE